jgi:hypothetical protein
MNHFAGKVVVGAQENLMKARDERIALMNEILGAIRMVKVRSSFLYHSLCSWLWTLVHGLGTQLRKTRPRHPRKGAQISTTELRD